MATRTLKKNNVTGRKSQRKSKAVQKREVKKVKKSKAKSMDYTFLALIIIMVCFGLVMVLSASAPASNVKVGNSYRFFSKQLFAAVFGTVVMLLVSRIDYRIYKRYVKLIVAACIILLILVLIPGIGSYYNGARRWIELKVIQIQPSELAKIAVIIYFAYMIEKTNADFSYKKFSAIIKLVKRYVIILAVIALLLVFEPHYSAIMIIAAIAAVILIAGGLPGIFIAIGCGIVSVGLAAIFKLDSNRNARFMSFLDPFSDIKGTGWQVVQALYAIGSGGLFGLGLGQSRQKYSFLPEPYNDFIFAVICEELGLVGAIVVIMLFVGLMIRGIKIAMEAPDTFGTLLVIGIVAQIIIQATFNIAVATASVPNTGISLPFFSFGGTAIVMLLGEMGIILNVSRYSRKKENI